MSDRSIINAARTLGRKGGKANTEAQQAARARNARSGGRRRLVHVLRGDWSETRVYATSRGWTVEADSRVRGDYTGRRMSLVYDRAPEWARHADVSIDHEDWPKLARWVLESPESKLLRAGILVR
jgi:hypothetical protein